MTEPESEPLAWVVGEPDAGARLDVVVSQRLGEPRSRSQQRLAAGEVTVGGVFVGKSHRVSAGERVSVRAPAPEPAIPVPDPVPVRYDDEHLAVIAKPADLVVHEGAGVSGGTLVDALRGMGMALAAGGGEERPGIVHRLDRGTSGLLAIAKTQEAYEALVGLMGRREVTRRYWVLVDGIPEQRMATIDAPIARDPARRTRFRADASGKPALTHYDVEETFASVARLTVRLETGRTHQVRVHLAAIGHPVVADGLYGASGARGRALGLERPALHAEHLSFTHPFTGERVTVDEPLPADLEAALGALRAGG